MKEYLMPPVLKNSYSPVDCELLIFKNEDLKNLILQNIKSLEN